MEYNEPVYSKRKFEVKMKLSCVIIICDKDYQNLSNIIKSISDNVSLDYEILVMDNRDKFADMPLEVETIKLGGNKFQFEAKRQAVMHYVHGEYVWFIDGDDLVTGCISDLSENADIYSFNFTLKSGNTNYSHHYEQLEIIDNPFTLSNSSRIGITMWAKYIKTDVLKKFYGIVPEGMRIHISEDAVAVICAAYLSKKVILTTESCYEYNDMENDSCCSYYSDVKKLERWTTGATDILKVMDMVIPKEDQNRVWIRSEDIYRNNLIDMMNKWFVCDDAIRERFVELILEYYTFDFIKWVMSCWNPLPYKTNLERMIFYECVEKVSSRLTRKEKLW